MDVSIVIVNWNTCDILRDCLVSIYKETKDIEFEVIVVDNASNDGSPQMVKSEFPQVCLIVNEQNLGFAAANNRGIEIASGRYVLLLNSDTVILDNAITKTLYFADENHQAGIVSCRVCNPDMTTQDTCFMFPSLLNMVLSDTYLSRLFPKSTFFGRERMAWFVWDKAFELDVIAGCFMLVRASVFEQVGVMDDSFFMYGEETDWCYRINQAGWKVMYTPHTFIIHLGGQSSSQVKSRMVLQLKGGILQFMQKHKSWLEYKLACMLVGLFFAVRIPVWFVWSLLNREKRSYCLMRMNTYIKGLKKLVCEGVRGLCHNKVEVRSCGE